MGFADTVVAGFIAGLGVLIVAGVAGAVWTWWHRPDVVIESLGSSISGVMPRERNSRWYHAGVRSRTATAARDPVVQVKGPGRNYEDWFFAEHLAGWPPPTAIRKTPLRIPIVAGVVGATQGFVAGQPIQPNTWHLTPNGGSSVVTFTSGPHTSHTFEVRVTWLRNGTSHRETYAEFRLVFGQPNQEPTFEKVEQRSRFRIRRVAR